MGVGDWSSHSSKYDQLGLPTYLIASCKSVLHISLCGVGPLPYRLHEERECDPLVVDPPSRSRAKICSGIVFVWRVLRIVLSYSFRVPKCFAWVSVRLTRRDQIRRPRMTRKLKKKNAVSRSKNVHVVNIVGISLLLVHKTFVYFYNLMMQVTRLVDYLLYSVTRVNC